MTLQSAREYEAAVRADIHTLVWPPGITLNVTEYVRSSWPNAYVSYRPGPGALVGIDWGCAWYMAWLRADAQHDKAAKAAAYRVMTTTLPPIMDRDDEEGRSYDVKIAKQAELGDPTHIKNTVENNCPASNYKVVK